MYKLYRVCYPEPLYILERQSDKTLSRFSRDLLIPPCESNTVTLTSNNYIAKDAKHEFLCDIPSLDNYAEYIQTNHPELLI